MLGTTQTGSFTAGEQIDYDNFNAVAVPEAASVALLISAAGLLCARRLSRRLASRA